MAVPDFQTFFKPLLEFCADGLEHSVSEAREKLKINMSLSVGDLAELIPSGRQSKFDNRTAWAKSYLVQAKVLEATRRSHFIITNRGRDLLAAGHIRIDNRVLSQFSEFVQFHTPIQNDNNTVAAVLSIEPETPEELLQKSYESIRNELVVELLNRIKTNSPKFFESLIVDFMIAMGYGGSRVDAGKAVGQSGDEGIDGIIKEDRLGLDIIYLQAKRWEGTVGRPEIQRFVGALHGKRAKKGVCITTGRFSEDAISYVGTIEPKVVLIDGRTLASQMIDLNLGTTVVAKYEIKKIDQDYFGED